jgi:chromate reductase
MDEWKPSAKKCAPKLANDIETGLTDARGCRDSDPSCEDARMLRILAISGSLRATSSNTYLLKAAELLAPENVLIEHYDGLGQLPHFNPDLPEPLPAPVLDLYARIERASGLLISCPEYARGIPGSFKNALDWLVGSSSFPDKPVALFNASSRAEAAQAALRLVLTTMSARLIEEASITIDLLSKRLDPQGIAASADMAPVLRNALQVYARALAANAAGAV